MLIIDGDFLELFAKEKRDPILAHQIRQGFGDLTIYDSAQGAVVRYELDAGQVSLVVLNGVSASQVSESDFSF